MGALHSWSNIFPEDDTDVLFLDQFKSRVSVGPVGDILSLPLCQNDDGVLARRFHSACWLPLSLSISLFFFFVPHVHDHGPPFFPSSSPPLFPCRNLAGPYGLYARHRPGGGVTKRTRRLGGQRRARCDFPSSLFLFPSLPPSLPPLSPSCPMSKDAPDGSVFGIDSVHGPSSFSLTATVSHFLFRWVKIYASRTHRLPHRSQGQVPLPSLLPLPPFSPSFPPSLPHSGPGRFSYLSQATVVTGVTFVGAC